MMTQDVGRALSPAVAIAFKRLNYLQTYLQLIRNCK
jgi:hypothetical protein